MDMLKTRWRKLLWAPIVVVRFLPFYLWEMTRSNVRVAQDALRKQPRFSPGIVEIDLAGYTPVQCWAATCLISMTPGTLVLDFPDGATALTVHVLYMDNEAEAKAELYRLLHKALGYPAKLKTRR